MSAIYKGIKILKHSTHRLHLLPFQKKKTWKKIFSINSRAFQYSTGKLPFSLHFLQLLCFQKWKCQSESKIRLCFAGSPSTLGLSPPTWKWVEFPATVYMYISQIFYHQYSNIHVQYNQFKFFYKLIFKKYLLFKSFSELQHLFILCGSFFLTFTVVSINVGKNKYWFFPNCSVWKYCLKTWWSSEVQNYYLFLDMTQ